MSMFVLCKSKEVLPTVNNQEVLGNIFFLSDLKADGQGLKCMTDQAYKANFRYHLKRTAYSKQNIKYSNRWHHCKTRYV